jgi:hypothetical protein
MDLLQKDVPTLTKIYEAKCFYDSQNNRIILYYKNRVTARTLVDFYNLSTTPPPNSSLYVIYDLQTGTFNVSTNPPTYTISNSKVRVTSPINAEYDMDKVIIYRISWYEKDTYTDLNHILTQLNTLDTLVREQQANTNNILTQLNTFVRKQQADTITATHTFDPTQPGPAFQLGPNAQNHLIQYLNADKVDGFDASQTPAPNTIPVADDNGKISINWLPQGTGSNLNADKVDGFDASLTPAPNVIPVTNNQSVIPQDFLPLFTPLSIPYSRLYIESSTPTSPQLYDSWCNTNTNELFYFNGSTWIKVDWMKWVQNDIWYRLGKLRINNGQLQVSNNGTNWYQVFPAIGRTVEVIADDTNSADNFKIAYLTVGQTLLVREKNLARAVAIEPSLWIVNYYHTYAGSSWFGIFPSNIAISDAHGETTINEHDALSGRCVHGRNYVPITMQASNAHNWAHFSIQIVNNRMTTVSVGYGPGLYSVNVTTGFGSFPSNGYFLGSFCYEGTRINVVYLAVTRQG